MKTKLAFGIALLCLSTWVVAADPEPTPPTGTEPAPPAGTEPAPPAAPAPAPPAEPEREGPKWSYVQAGYMDFNPEGGVSDDGWYAGGSSKIAMFHFFAEYDDVGNYTFWNAGLGWHGLLGKPADLYFQAQYNGIETDAANVSDHDGYEVSGGVRWKIFNWLEVKGQLNWADYGDAGDVWSGDAGVLFSVFKDRLGFGADVIVAENANTVRGYIRWSFR